MLGFKDFEKRQGLSPWLASAIIMKVIWHLTMRGFAVVLSTI
jgi:predicted membrane-bound dolichyl-phosphate-mannose-protein mannosyltransferase